MSGTRSRLTYHRSCLKGLTSSFSDTVGKHRSLPSQLLPFARTVQTPIDHRFTSFPYSLSKLSTRRHATLIVDQSPLSFDWTNPALQNEPQSICMSSQQSSKAIPKGSQGAFPFLPTSLSFNTSAAVPVPSVPGTTSQASTTSPISGYSETEGSSSPSYSFRSEVPVPLEPLLVVIDLDETLFFSHLNPQSPHDFSIQVDRQEIYVSLRPGCKEFLEWCSQNFETGLYTAGTEGYVKALMDKIDPVGRLITKSNHRYRSSCWPVQYEVRINQKSVIQTLYTKDLSLFRKNLSRVVLIDNSLFSFMLQPDNGIPIADWRGHVVSKQPVVETAAIHAKMETDIIPDVTVSPALSSAHDMILETMKNSDTSQPQDETVLIEIAKMRKEETPVDSKEEHAMKGVVEELKIKTKEEKTISSVNEEKHQEVDVDNSESKSSTVVSSESENLSIEDEEKKKLGEFYVIKKTLEELKDADDVKPILRQKYHVVDHIIRRCISGMITSSRL